MFTIAYGENDQGIVTGRYLLPNHTALGFVRHPDGTITTPGLPFNSFSTLLGGVNNSDIAAGGYLDFFGYHGATYNIDTDTWTALPDIAGTVSSFAVSINNADLVIGEAISGFDMQGNPAGVRGYFHSGSGYTFFDAPNVDPTATGTIPEDINDDGTVVGFYSQVGRNGLLSGFVRDSSGHYTTVDYPGADSTFFEGINNQGLVAGSYDVGGISQNFLWSAANGFTLLNLPIGVNPEVWGIDNAGHLTGDYIDPQQGIIVGFATVPEPGSIASLVGLGVAGTALLRRRKRIRHAV